MFTSNTVQATTAFLTLLFFSVASVIAFFVKQARHEGITDKQGESIVKLEQEIAAVKSSMLDADRHREASEGKTQEILVQIQTSMAAVVSTVTSMREDIREERGYTRKALDELRSKIGVTNGR